MSVHGMNWLAPSLSETSSFLRRREADPLFSLPQIAQVRAATFLPVPEPRMPGQPNRDYRQRCASLLSCHRPYCGAVRLQCSQPIESVFIGSAFTCVSWIRPHLMHLSVQCSELSLKVGDGGNREGGISWGCLTPPLLHRRSDMPCPKITSSS